MADSWLDAIAAGLGFKKNPDDATAQRRGTAARLKTDTPANLTTTQQVFPRPNPDEGARLAAIAATQTPIEKQLHTLPENLSTGSGFYTPSASPQVAALAEKVGVPKTTLDLDNVPRNKTVAPAAVVPEVSPKPVPAVQPSTPATAPVGIEPAPIPSAEVGPIQPEITFPPQPQGIDWNKVGEIAKQTGGSILGVLQAAIAGRTAGLAGRAFNPATDTMLGIQSGKAQDAAIQQAAMERSAKLQEHLKALDQDFQSRQAQIAQDFQAKQSKAEMDFQANRDEAQYKRQLELAAAERDQRMKELQIAGANAMTLERMRQGMSAGGAGADPSNIRGYNPASAPAVKK